MKITKTQLKQIIKEELETALLSEESDAESEAYDQFLQDFVKAASSHPKAQDAESEGFDARDVGRLAKKFWIRYNLNDAGEAGITNVMDRFMKSYDAEEEGPYHDDALSAIANAIMDISNSGKKYQKGMGAKLRGFVKMKAPADKKIRAFMNALLPIINKARKAGRTAEDDYRRSYVDPDIRTALNIVDNYAKPYHFVPKHVVMANRAYDDMKKRAEDLLKKSGKDYDTVVIGKIVDILTDPKLQTAPLTSVRQRLNAINRSLR